MRSRIVDEARPDNVSDYTILNEPTVKGGFFYFNGYSITVQKLYEKLQAEQ
jgi:hypothetical protein